MRPGMPRAYPAEFRERVLARYREGQGGYHTVADEFGCSHETVRVWVKNAGVVPNPSGGLVGLYRSDKPRWYRRRQTSGYMQWECRYGGRTHFIPEHRVLMERHLGRSLLPGESVHHRNGQRDDNRIENLELWVTWQPSGQRPAELVAWAREVLARYAP